MRQRNNVLIPHEVVGRLVAGASPLRAWREHLGFSQNDVAAMLGITQSAYAQLESSERPRKATLQRFASALGLSVDQLTL